MAAKTFRIVKIIILTILTLIGGVLLLLWYISTKAILQEEYYNDIDAKGCIESIYSKTGDEAVEKREIAAVQNFGKYLIFHPTRIAEGTERFPVVIFSNGTGVKASRYQAQLKRLASWGFIVIGTDEENSWNGFSSEMCLRLMIKLNDNEKFRDWESNPFYQRVDLENIGVTGHSQGGVGVFNAAIENKHGNMIKSIVSLSPTNIELSHALEWDYDPSRVQVPTLLVSGCADGFEQAVVTGGQLSEIYNAIPDSVQKLKMRIKDADHGATLFRSDGYTTAWFMWHLKSDKEASKAFMGSDAEILSNMSYQDIEKNL